jgi:chitodextrinase
MRRTTRIGIAFAAVLVTFGLLPVPPASPAYVSYSPTPLLGWSTNGIVRTVLVVGDTVYAGGEFTQVRGPGGSPVVNRARLAAWDARTGELRTGFSADASARVQTLASDGTRLFVGGDFTTIKGVSRVRLASVDLTTGNVNTGFAAGATSRVWSLAASGGRLFVAGSFGTLGGQPRSRIAAVSTTTGAVDPTFNPSADNTILAVAVSPDGGTVYAGGDFFNIGGGARSWIAPLSATTGTLLPLTFQYPLVATSVPSVIDLDLSPSGDRLFAALGGYENQALSWSTVTGRRQWSHQVDGDAQAVRYSSGNVYFGFHEGDLGDPTVRMLAADSTTGQVVPNYRLPINSFYGVWDIDSSPDTLAIGGEFTNVNGVAVQGLAILPRTVTETTPPTPPTSLRVTGTTATSIALAWNPGTDDQGVVGYRVLRNGVEIGYAAGTAYTDTDLAAASDFTYEVQSVDASANRSPSAGPLPAGTDLTLVPLGATWRYLANGSNQGTAWRATTFDDGAWPSGPAQLGYGDGDEATVVPFGPDPNNKYMTTYFRRQISIANPSALTNVNLTLLRDDGAIVYVNGVEVARSNMPAGNVTNTTAASTNVEGAAETALFNFTVPPARFVAGTNTIAVEVHQNYRSSSDVSFDLGLSTGRQLGPGTPANLRTTSVTDATVGLAWDAPAGTITGYRVLRDGTAIANPTGTTFTDTGLTSAQTYSYSVTALNGTLESSATAPLVVTTPDVVAPTAPSALTAPTVTASSVALTWTGSTDNVAVTAYDVLRDGTVIASPTGASYTDSAVAAEQNYSYTVRARDAAGNPSPPSEALAVTTPPVPPSAPATPANLRTTSVAATTVGLAWDAPVGTITGYRVFRDGTQVDAPTGTSFTDTGLTSAQTYSYSVTALNGTLESSPTTPLVVTTPDVIAPTAPSGLTAPTVTASQVALTWTASTDNVAVTAYDVLRDGTVIASPTGTSYTDTTVSAATSYTYTVRARDAAGNPSDPSNAQNVTTPAAPTSLFSDTWPGANGSAWSSAWTTDASNGTIDTQNGSGRLACNDVTGAFARAQLSGLAARTDSEVVFSYQWNATGPSAYFSVNLRGSGGWLNAYRPRNGYGIELSSGSATATIYRASNGVTTSLASVPGAQPLTTARQWIRVRVVGSTIQFKRWLDGQSEPAAWTATVTDTTVTAPGQLFLALSRSGSNVGSKGVSIDDLTVVNPS